jgi:Tol biopolymer transport system component
MGRLGDLMKRTTFFPQHGDKKPPLGWRAQSIGPAVAIAALAVGLAAGTEPVRAAFPGSNGLIAVSSGRGHVGLDIWVMNASGGEAKQLTDDPADDTDPAFSPDGRKIAFVRDYFSVWVMNADGSDQTLVAREARDPAWTPDGRISYAWYDKQADRLDIWTVGADGTNPQLAILDGISPAWSPDGTKVAFIRDDNLLFVANADGTAAVQVASNAEDPNWAPDSSRIVFGRRMDADGIALVNADGSGLTILSTLGSDSDPAFSPDGTIIAITVNAGDQIGLHLIDTYGNTVADLAPYPSYDLQADWQPVPPLPTVDITDATVTEGNTATTDATFQVTLSQASAATVTVDYATADGTATAPDDYAATSGTLTFAPGETAKTVVVAVVGDTLVEPNETLTVTLSAPTDATLGHSTATGTVVNDDTPPALPSLAIADTAVAEGNTGRTNATFQVTLSQASAATVTVGYATADGTAKEPRDYAATRGILTFAPGETAKTVVVAVEGDTLVEADDTFTVSLSAPTNATLGDGTATCTIIDEDAIRPPVAISISDAIAVTEGSQGKGGRDAVFAVSLSRPVATAVTVHYATADGTAVAPADYRAVSGTLVFTGRDRRQEIRVPIVRDDVHEQNETFTVLLSNPVGAEIADGSAIGTIVDDTLVPTADLAVSIWQRQRATSVPIGGQVTYAVDVSALGARSTVDAVLAVTLPSAFGFVSARPDTCTATAGDAGTTVVTCALRVPAGPGGRPGASVAVVATAAVQNGGYPVVAAAALAPGSPFVDPRSDNNVATDVTFVGRIADLALSLRLSSISIRDNTQTLAGRVRNLGPDSSPAQLTVTFPAGFVFPGRQRCTAAGQTITCQLPAMTTRDGGIWVEIRVGPPAQPGDYTITGTVVPTGTTPAYDPRPSNNTVSVVDRITAPGPKR